MNRNIVLVVLFAMLAWSLTVVVQRIDEWPSWQPVAAILGLIVFSTLVILVLKERPRRTP